MAEIEDQCFVVTKCAQLRKDAAESFEYVVFESRRKSGGNKKLDSTQKNKSLGVSGSDIDIRRVKRDVIKFGLTGFDAKTKQEAKIEHAIRLGAKPPKNKYVNYKQFKSEKARQLKELEEEKRLMDAGKVKGISSDKGKKYMALKNRKDMKKDNILQAYGKVQKNFRNKKGRKKR